MRHSRRRSEHWSQVNTWRVVVEWQLPLLEDRRQQTTSPLSDCELPEHTDTHSLSTAHNDHTLTAVSQTVSQHSSQQIDHTRRCQSDCISTQFTANRPHTSRCQSDCISTQFTANRPHTDSCQSDCVSTQFTANRPHTTLSVSHQFCLLSFSHASFKTQQQIWTRKCGNCERIATSGSRMPRSPCPL